MLYTRCGTRSLGIVPCDDASIKTNFKKAQVCSELIPSWWWRIYLRQRLGRAWRVVCAHECRNNAAVTRRTNVNAFPFLAWCWRKPAA